MDIAFFAILGFLGICAFTWIWRRIRANRELKWAERAQVGSDVALAIAGIIALFTYVGQLYQMRKSNEAARAAAYAAMDSADAALAELRPWIKIQNAELRGGIRPIKTLMFHSPLTGDAVRPTLQFKVSVVNVGHSVAQDVEVWPEFFFGKFISDKWHDAVTQEQKRFCQSVANRTPSGAARLVFPSESSEQNLSVDEIVSDTYIGSSMAQNAASLIVCVNYRGTPRTQFQTQAWFGLYEDNSTLIQIGTDVDSNRLKLIRDENGDHAN